MPITILKDQLLTVSEFVSFLKENGDLSPTRTLRKLENAGLQIRVGKLILGKELLAAIENSGGTATKQ